MSEKELLISLIDRLNPKEISALTQIVNAMVSPSDRTSIYPEEELTLEEEEALRVEYQGFST